MENYEVLTKCESKDVSPKKAYRELYGHEKHYKLKKAHFIKVRIRINESPGLSVFLAFLLACPIPIGIAKMFIRKKMDEIVSESFPVTYRQLFSEFMVRGIKVEVDAKNEAKIYIKTI